MKTSILNIVEKSIFLFISILLCILSITTYAQEPQQCGNGSYTGPIQIQPVLNVTHKAGIILVQFSDSSANEDSRGSYGFSGITGIEHKYRCRDYWNLIFQPSGSIQHPDASTHNIQYSANGLDFNVAGSVKNFWEENSYGLYHVQDANTRSGETGIVNNVGYKTNFSDGKIEWIILTDHSTKEQYNSAIEVAQEAIRKAVGQKIRLGVDISTTEFDKLVIIYAGIGSFSTANTITAYKGEYSFEGKTYTYIVAPEKYLAAQPYYNAAFNYVSVFAHEWGHFLGLGDEYINGNQPRVTNHFSIMGWNGKLSRYSPAHLDPLSKIQLGWLDYHIVQNNRPYQQLDLPIVEEKYDGGKPFVLIVPNDIGWRNANPVLNDPGSYYIIENRRARQSGFDSYINKNDENEGGYGNEGPDKGGFLIWRWQRPPDDYSMFTQTVVEADGKYDMTKLNGGYGSPSDFFNDKVFAPWTVPSTMEMIFDLHDNSGNLTPDPYNGLPKIKYASGTNVIVFPQYQNTTSKINTISIISVDHPYSNIFDATKHNNQRKVCVDGSNIMSTYVIKDNPNSPDGMVVTSHSSDGGTTWQQTYLLNDVSYNTSGVRTIDHPANAPSIAYFGNNFHVVWQEKAGNTYSIKISIPGDKLSETLIDNNIQSSGEGPLPVIANRIENGVNTTIVAYATNNGIKKAYSTDLGNSWTSDLIQNTAGASYPTISAIDNHEFLAFQNGDNIFSSIDKAIPEILNNNWSKYSNNKKPSVTICKIGSDYVAHIVWETKVIEAINEDPPLIYENHYKIAHAEWNLNAQTNKNIADFFFNKYSVNEIATDPVISPINSTNISEADCIWIANNGDVNGNITNPGVRMRIGKYRKTGDKYNWSGLESERSTKKTSFPSLAALTNDSYYSVINNDNSPYSVFSNKVSSDGSFGGILLSDRISVIDILSNPINKNIAARLTAYGIKLISGQDVLGTFYNSGFPEMGFDGTINGPSLYDLMKSESIFLQQGQAIAWNMRYNKDSLFLNPDTVFVNGYLIDAITNTILGPISTEIIAPTCFDTTFTFYFELPSGYQSANVILSCSLSGGPIDFPDRYLAVENNIYFYYANTIPKRMHSDQTDNSSTTDLRAEIFPNLSNNITHIKFTLNEDSPVKFFIYDLMGRLVKQNDNVFGKEGWNDISLENSNLQNGIYIYHITSNHQQTSGKITIVR